ncbi:uncharacterized protein LOC113070648, partial [Tachysurus ichikawai]
VPLGDILHSAQNLVLMLTNTLSVGQQKMGNQCNIRGQSAQERRSKSNGQSVQQEMARSFFGFFKKKVGGETELQLTLAGLGKRSLTITENMTHSELSEVLVKAYPKLAKYAQVCGGGHRKLTVIPPDPDRYNGQQLKTVSSNGKCTMYVVPLQEQIDTTPLPPDAREFEKMPKTQCTLCSQMVPLQCLPVHIKHCKVEHVDLCSSSDDVSLCLFYSPMSSKNKVDEIV